MRSCLSDRFCPFREQRSRGGGTPVDTIPGRVGDAHRKAAYGAVMDRSHRLMPAVATVAGIATFSAMDAVVKAGSLEAGVYTILVLRSVMGTVLMGALWRLTRTGPPSRAAVRIHALRSAVVAAMALLFFWGLVRIPLAEGIAISFFAPLIALYLAAVLLGETIRPQAIAASLLGLIGVVIIALGRLGAEQAAGNDEALGIAAIVASAVLYAWNLVLQRQQAQIAAPQEIALFQNLFVGLYLLPAAPFLLEAPTAFALIHAGAAALLAGISLLLLSWAYARAEAQALVPLEYTGFIWAALLGWWWFDEALRWTTVAGAGLIVVATWLSARPAARTGKA